MMILNGMARLLFRESKPGTYHGILKSGIVNGVGTVSNRSQAGTLTGMTEALIAVTPTETIKTKLIHDQTSKNPRYHGTVHGSMGAAP